jgi:argininosuccinate lyase
VRKYNIAFRTSHKIAGAIVKSLIDSNKTLIDVTPELVQKIALDNVNIKLTAKKQDLLECTNPRKLVEMYKVLGGPSPKEVYRAIKAKNKTLKKLQADINKLKENIANAKNTLDITVKNCI